tara:strand:- start:74 stop:841 length:768 start_codon:yes stop_codon:yes gene_type:complete
MNPEQTLDFLKSDSSPDFEDITVTRKGVPPLKFRIRSAPWSDRKAIAECIDRNTYQKPRLGFRIEPGEEWIDCGANVGGFSCLVNAMGAKLVAAYEPHGPNLVMCHTNLRANGFDPTVAQGYAVVADSVGPIATLNVNAKPIQARRHSMVLSRKGSKPVDVPTVKFSDIARDRCVKMNIEGAEIKILQELQEPIPLKMVTEWSFDVERRVDVLRGVLKKLEGWYENVRINRTIPPDLEEYHFFPPNVFIYCWGRK